MARHIRKDTDMCLLNEVDHPRISVGHFPVFGERFQILVSHHIISKVHGTICLVVTWDSLYPIRRLRMPLSVFCYSNRTAWKVGKVTFSSNSLKSNKMPNTYCKFPCLLCPHSAITFEKTNKHTDFLFIC